MNPLYEDEEVPDCDICHGSGWLHPLKEDGKPDYSKTARCECRHKADDKQKQERYLELCKIPPGKSDLTFETFKVRPGLESAHDAALQLADDTGAVRWLTLMSGVDRGKTHLALAVCRRWLDKGRPARYVYVPDMLDELRSSYDNEGEDSYKSMFYGLCNMPLLVLDDFPSEREMRTQWAIEKMEQLVHNRDTHGLPLMVTTNKALDELPNRVESRLKRVKGSVIINIKAEEYRVWEVER